MSTVKTSADMLIADPSSQSAVNIGQSPVVIDQKPLIGSKHGEKLATIDQLPRGTALHAARTQLTKENARTTSVSSQITKGTSVLTALSHSNLTSSTISNNEHSRGDGDAPPSAEEEAPANNEVARKFANAADLARRAAHRVNVWKKSEHERRGEEERNRQVKVDQEKRRQNHAAYVKQRRRAEIYALNAFLRELQREKVAKYIAAQKQLQDGRQQQGCQKGALSTASIALAQVRTVGV